MITLFGPTALSDAARKKLLQQLKAIDDNISGVTAQYVHFVDADELSTQDRQTLETLLSYGEVFQAQKTKQEVLVLPRFGTISPWSSKATDIAHNSGLAGVRRVERGVVYYLNADKNIETKQVAHLLHDRMTEIVLSDFAQAEALFSLQTPESFETVDVLAHGKTALQKANKTWGLALSEDEIDYLANAYRDIERNPTDVELMMFAQVNSEHCRHKIFNADWIIDGKKQPKSLFKMIKNTYESSSENICSAYSDNAAVLNGALADRYFPDPDDNVYKKHREEMPIVIKVETHNHPTAIAPNPGAATGTGGEIRDESATGRGARSKMGLTGFSVSNLNLPGAQRPWEKSYGKPARISSPLDIMLEAPIGGASYANEFGRANLAGYFRTYEQVVRGDVVGYHKPIMIAGGLGNIRKQHIEKKQMPVGTKIIVLGGPAMLIGLGGSAASSMQTGESEEDLDFASVQRANAEVERRVQEVINACWALDDKNPILTIHDVGAGGLSNALPELVHDSGRGARFELRDVPNAEPSMSPMEIWCNESQERYVLGVAPKDLARFEQLCARERCPYAVVGEATTREQLVLHDQKFNNTPVDIPMELLFGKPPKMTREASSFTNKNKQLDAKKISIKEAVTRVLQLPAVASKKFLITIGDRTVGGLTVRDQMVGPWQVPVADVAVTASSFESKFGEALAMGERTPIATLDAAASARVALGEVITNMAAANIEKISDIKLSANWMAAAGHAAEDKNLYDAVKTLGEDFCPALGMTIPVGKDSLSMRTVWEDNKKEKSVTSPLSLILTGFAPVVDVDKTLTPQLDMTQKSELLLIDLGQGKNRLGGSALAQVYSQTGSDVPDVEPEILKNFFASIQELNNKGLLLAYHDRSDGGLLTTLCEMAFASRCGLGIDLQDMDGSHIEKLFSEELGAVVQVSADNYGQVVDYLKKSLGDGVVYRLGQPTKQQNVVLSDGKKIVYKNSRANLEQTWADTSYRIQSMRDNAALAKQEHDLITKNSDSGIPASITFEPLKLKYSERPKVAIFREQGVNGQVEMAYAFDKAGFTAIDVHLNDLMSGSVVLDDFVGLAACGGFSYGDVLGAGEGWAKSILCNEKLRTQFQEFFERPDTFSLGVCNGCQMLSALKEIIPGAESWPRFLKNTSEQFEARLTSVQVNKSPSIFLRGMEGSVLPVPVAHGEGRADFDAKPNAALVALQYVDSNAKPTEKYPYNPNGSQQGMTGFTTQDGRATIMMPHPERGFLTSQLSWHPQDWSKEGPWLRMFQNARKWVG